MLAFIGLKKTKKREVELCSTALKSAKSKLTSKENKIKNKLYKKGVDNQRVERERKKWLIKQYTLYGRGITAPILIKKLLLI